MQAIRKKPVTVFLTEHYVERYRERVGDAPLRVQKAMLARSIKAQKPRRLDDGKQKVKLRGIPHMAVVKMEHGAWIGITVE